MIELSLVRTCVAQNVHWLTGFARCWRKNCTGCVGLCRTDSAQLVTMSLDSNAGLVSAPLWSKIATLKLACPVIGS